MSPFLRRTPIGRDDAFDGVMVVAAAPSRDTSVYKSYPADIPFTTCNILRGVFRGVDRIEPKLDVTDSLYRPRRAHNYADFLAAHAEPQAGNVWIKIFARRGATCCSQQRA